ncbi:GCN5-related N-acetyltransferase [Naegleria gruberi]|uniref:GCN5-related N-acetyltransferase n=1 Tax=Naegleria gruberi TaxID=5762 RepID=D2W3Z2_NAEGR|nr:GCN5-related N-acetyltransferase [Naegleria gruberi]EFC36203.1 GCN5-related N-acetyltransferase [Naegleria gruberi]|eukprot:XP_002668947.1 GCN5-related N-acetyltransferase [Naegleria gruberi strain NEG-M]
MNFTNITIRKPSLTTEDDVSLLTSVAKTLFYEAFHQDNTEENMRDYLEQAFNTTQQVKELTDPNVYLSFIQVDYDNALEEYLKQKCTPERIEFLDSNMSFYESNQKKLVIAYSKLNYGSFEPCLKYQNKETIELCRCYVLKEFHGTSIAHKLMQECLRVAREEFGGVCKSIWLGVWEHNLRAKRFYEKFKFEKVGEHVFVMGDDPQRDEVYELIL